jgi:hypothetical protein
VAFPPLDGTLSNTCSLADLVKPSLTVWTSGGFIRNVLKTSKERQFFFRWFVVDALATLVNACEEVSTLSQVGDGPLSCERRLVSLMVHALILPRVSHVGQARKTLRIDDEPSGLMRSVYHSQSSCQDCSQGTGIQHA